MLIVMAGPHPRDPFSVPDDGTDYPAATRRSVSGLKIAYSADLDIFPVEERVLSVVGEAVRAFEETGARVEETSMGLKHDQRELSSTWMREVGVRYAEITAHFSKEGVVDLLGEHREDLTPQLVNLLETGQKMSALDYRLDDVTRTEVFDAIQDLFEHYDLLLTPTLAVPPFDNADDGNTVGPSEINGEEVDPLLG